MKMSQQQMANGLRAIYGVELEPPALFHPSGADPQLGRSSLLLSSIYIHEETLTLRSCVLYTTELLKVASTYEVVIYLHLSFCIT